MKKMIMGLMVLLFSVGLFGCETMKGLGRDISKAGDKIEEAAKK